jgi:hypothetical protein
MSDSLYMLKCPNRSYFARYTVILITSRDFAILLLYRCLWHFHTKHELRTIFHHLNFFKSDRKSQIAFFWKISYKRKFSFLLIFCTRNRHSTVIENYIKWCDQIRTWSSSHWKNWFIIWLHRWLSIVVAKNVDKSSQIVVTKHLINFHRLLSRSTW